MNQELNFDIFKVSVNEWENMHWAKKKDFKHIYKTRVNQITKAKRLHGTFEVEYHFGFIKNPLDATNCYAMVKILEDLLFMHDEYNTVIGLTIKSRFSETNKDNVRIVIKPVDRL